MSKVYLGLGSNLGNREEQLLTAIQHLKETAGPIPAISGFYETSAWGYQSRYPFLNAAVQLETPISPYELLHLIQQIEQSLGRTAKTINRQYTDRPIDIDILLYDNMILQTPELILPHPFMHQRLFVLQPLSEIAPNLVHPVLNKTIAELYSIL